MSPHVSGMSQCQGRMSPCRGHRTGRDSQRITSACPEFKEFPEDYQCLSRIPWISENYQCLSRMRRRPDMSVTCQNLRAAYHHVGAASKKKWLRRRPHMSVTCHNVRVACHHAGAAARTAGIPRELLLLVPDFQGSPEKYQCLPRIPWIFPRITSACPGFAAGRQQKAIACGAGLTCQYHVTRSALHVTMSLRRRPCMSHTYHQPAVSKRKIKVAYWIGFGR